MEQSFESTNINGQDYYTIKQFAELTNRTEQSVRYLIKHGNRIRVLAHTTIGEKPFVLASELTE